MPPLGRHGKRAIGPFLPTGPPTVEHFREMLGMCAHAQWINQPDTVYDPLSDWQHVVDLAVESGISWHRTEIPIGQAYMRDGLKAKHLYTISKGMKVTLILNGYWSDADAWYGTVEAQLNWLLANFPVNGILAFESVNEPDLFHSENGNWPSLLVDHMVRVANAVRSHPEFDGIPILGPGLCFDTAYPLGQTFIAKGVDPRDVMDFYTPHPYDGGDMPKTAHMDSERTKYLPLGRGDGPPWPTEWGYYTALQTPDYAPVDERTQAVYVAKGWATHFLKGARHSAYYTFCDTQSGNTNSENTFGLVRSDYTPKLSWTTLKRMMDWLGPKQAPVSPSSRAYSVSGPPEIRHFQVQRADGSHVVFLWRETLVWNRDTRVPIPVAPLSVVIDCQGATFAALNPITGAMVPMLGGGLPVDGDLYLVELR